MSDTIQRYKAVFTPFGKQQALNAYDGGSAIVISYMGIGDGGGEEYTPQFGQQDLLNEWHEIEANSLSRDPTNPHWLIAQGLIREDVGGHWIREISLKDGQHRVLAVASWPGTYKPILEEGSAMSSVVRFVLEVQDTDVFELTIDTSLALVTRNEFLDRVQQQQNAHETHIQRQQDVHGSTSNATPNAIAERDNLGRASFGAPSELSHAARLKEVNDVFEKIKSTNYFTDLRDGKVYRTVKIGKQVWMAENLAWTGAGSWYNPPGDREPFNKAGRLYTWAQALTAAPPPGWHLPTDAEWYELFRFVDGVTGEGPYESATAGALLKARSGWNNNGGGTDDFGFTALPGGSRDAGNIFYSLGSIGNWWSATESDGSSAYRFIIPSDPSKTRASKTISLSVRCLQNAF